MTSSHLVALIALLAAVWLVLGLLIPKASAQEPVCFSLDRMATKYELIGIPVWRVPPERLVPLMLATNHKVKGATRALVIQNDPLSGGRTVIGYEVDGCLIPPFFLPAVPTAPPTLSAPPLPGIEASCRGCVEPAAHGVGMYRAETGA